MNELVSSFSEHVKKIDKFSIIVIRQGLKLAFLLILLSAFFYLLAGKFGDYFTVLSCAKGALEAAPAVLTTVFISALISDIAIKDRAAKE